MVALRMRLFVWLFVVGCWVCMIAACVPLTTPTPESFNIESPPEGWHRVENSLFHYWIWLPADWAYFETAPDDDYKQIPYFVPKDERYSGVQAEVEPIYPVDFVKDPRAPNLWQFWGRSVLPDSTYQIMAGNLLIPCARYKLNSVDNTYSLQHICVISSYSAKRFLPNWPEEIVDFETSLSNLAERDEAELLPAWHLMVESFALEQPPDENISTYTPTP